MAESGGNLLNVTIILRFLLDAYVALFKFDASNTDELSFKVTES